MSDLKNFFYVYAGTLQGRNGCKTSEKFLSKMAHYSSLHLLSIDNIFCPFDIGTPTTCLSSIHVMTGDFFFQKHLLGTIS